MGFWESRRVLVTGAGGFLGSYVVEALRPLLVNDVPVEVPTEAKLPPEDPGAR